MSTAVQSLRTADEIATAGSDSEFDAAFQKIARSNACAILVGTDPFFNSRRGRIVELAAQHAIPAIVRAARRSRTRGGLMSYGTSLTDGYRQAGIYVGRILKGGKPGDLPVVQSTQFEFVINLKTAKALGLDIRRACWRSPTKLIESTSERGDVALRAPTAPRRAGASAPRRRGPRLRG